MGHRMRLAAARLAKHGPHKRVDWTKVCLIGMGWENETQMAIRVDRGGAACDGPDLELLRPLARMAAGAAAQPNQHFVKEYLCS